MACMWKMKLCDTYLMEPYSHLWYQIDVPLIARHIVSFDYITRVIWIKSAFSLWWPVTPISHFIVLYWSFLTSVFIAEWLVNLFWQMVLSWFICCPSNTSLPTRPVNSEILLPSDIDFLLEKRCTLAMMVKSTIRQYQYTRLWRFENYLII